MNFGTRAGSASTRPSTRVRYLLSMWLIRGRLKSGRGRMILLDIRGRRVEVNRVVTRIGWRGQAFLPGLCQTCIIEMCI